jgi:putative transposase
MSLERRRQMIEPEHPRLSVVRQCERVSISRSGFCRHPAGESPLNLELRGPDLPLVGLPYSARPAA